MDSDIVFLIGCAIGVVAGCLIASIYFARTYARVRQRAEDLEDALYRERHRGMPAAEEEWPEVIEL